MQKITKLNKIDKFQKDVVECDSNLLVIAGAGSGKTFTMLNKIEYLITTKNVLPGEILVISFTNASVNDITLKLNFGVDCFTFHKLAMKILDVSHINYQITNENLLNFIINECIYTCTTEEQKHILKFLKYAEKFSNFIKSPECNAFKKFIATFINLWKTNDYKFENIPLKKLKANEKSILLFIFKIYSIYIEEKNSQNKLDFDDLIKLASLKVKDSSLKYKYLIIDEFQDTSLIRLNLLKQIYNYTHSQIIVVGDDYQSIYRFSGCNLNIFLNFSNYFPDVKTITLQNVYRNSQELIDIATAFITKNPRQISKNLKSQKHTLNPIIFVPYNNKINCFKNILNTVLNTTKDVMVLSRNNRDIYDYIDNDFEYQDNVLTYQDTKIKFYTVHKSKGLEAEAVIILNCNDNILGFPNKIESNKLINKIFPFSEIKFAEERRLFYVALTRTKNKVYLLYDKYNPSCFIKELKKIVKSKLNSIVYFK